MSFSIAAVAAISLALAILFQMRGKFPKAQIPLMLVAGLGLTGLLGQLLSRSASMLQNMAGVATSKVFGVGVPVLLVLIVALIVFFDLKDGSPSKGSLVLAILLPSLCVLAGGVFGMVAGMGRDGVGAMGPFFSSLLGGW